MAKKQTLKLKTEQKDYMTVEIEGRGTFEVPLPGSLPLSKMKELWDLQKTDDDGSKALDWSIDFFRTYLGDVVDEMTLNDFVGLSTAWQETSSPSLGE